MRRLMLVLLLIVLASAGCSYMMPPQKIPMDRRNYIDAVSTSWKEQLLTNLVKLRYGDTLTCLEMTSINTSYSLEAALSAGYSTPWHFLVGTTGARNSFTGGGALTYSDRPTISYTPIRGEALTKTLITPIDLSKILKSLQTGWKVDYLFPCCVKSINDLRNPSDPGFFDLAQRFGELKDKGVIRITIDEAKGPTKYDVTVHMQDKICQEKEKVEPGKEQARKAGMKPEKGKENGGGTDKKKEEKEDSAIGLLVLDKDRAKHENMEVTVKEFKKLLWSKYPPLEKDLYDLYNINCSRCHGAKGTGAGPDSAALNLKPANFNDPKFWAGDVDQKITQAAKKGHEKIVKLHMKDDDLNAVIAYIKRAFGRYEVYKIIDGNQQPRPSDPYCDKIVMQTRSILQVLIMLSEFINVPPEHIKENRVKEITPKEKEPMIKLTIINSKERPGDDFAAMHHRGYWFYIDDKDYDSKDIISGISGILSMSESGTKEGAPVLTLPVQ